MQIEAKVLEPGETEVEMRMVATLDQWGEVRSKVRADGPCSEFCELLDEKIWEVTDRLRTIVEGEKQKADDG